MSRDTHREANLIDRAATAGVVALAAGSFALSYDALHQLAEANQVPKPLAWIWPLIVDGFILVASLAILHAVQHGRTARYPWALLVSFSTLSVAFDVLHAPPTAIARLVAAIPPLTLVLSFELLMRQLRDRIPAAVHPPVAIEPHDARAVPEPHDPADALAVATAASGSLLQHARQVHEQHRENGIRLTGKVLGDVLGISDGYARRLLRDINATEMAPKPGEPRSGKENSAGASLRGTGAVTT